MVETEEVAELGSFAELARHRTAATVGRGCQKALWRFGEGGGGLKEASSLPLTDSRWLKLWLFQAA